MTSGVNPATPATAGRKFLWLGLALAALAFVADQVVKFSVEANMTLGQAIEVIPGFFDIHYILNSGAAFSFGEQFTVVFTLLQAAVAVYCGYLLIRKVSTLSWGIVLGCLLGGVAGNLYDRLFREPSFGMGHVVDMFSVHGFAIFNVADSFIVCSMIMVALLLIRGVNFDGTRESSEPKGGELSGDKPVDEDDEK
ncbi:signal peptidase II [Glutamicibacter endophyticus]|uniref:signal peptidase II n=1 Tax=Glutamicibacter endophyticus TaxID=1522174 RepID=UPI003AF07DF9